MTRQGDVWWADLGPARGSRPAKHRPVLVVQADRYNNSSIATVVVAIISSNTDLARMPGNVFLPSRSTGLPNDSVVNVTQLFTIGKAELIDPAGMVADDLLREVDRGLRRVLQL